MIDTEETQDPAETEESGPLFTLESTCYYVNHRTLYMSQKLLKRSFCVQNTSRIPLGNFQIYLILGPAVQTAEDTESEPKSVFQKDRKRQRELEQEEEEKEESAPLVVTQR